MTAGGTALQYEFAFNLGLVIAQRHLVTLQGDTYSVNLNTGTAELSNVNSQVGLFYTYAFR